jgi:hypothetical protein
MKLEKTTNALKDLDAICLDLENCLNDVSTPSEVIHLKLINLQKAKQAVAISYGEETKDVNNRLAINYSRESFFLDRGLELFIRSICSKKSITHH